MAAPMVPHPGPLVYDPVRHRMIAFMNTATDTTQPELWQYDIEARSWSPIATTGAVPHSGSLVYDSIDDALLVVQKQDPQPPQDLWTGSRIVRLPLAGSAVWSQVEVSYSPPRSFRGYAPLFDPVRHRLMVCRPDSVLVLDLTVPRPGWELLDLDVHSSRPLMREGATEIYDPARDHVVMFGGFMSGRGFSDVWSLDLSGAPAWTLLAPVSPLKGTVGVYDSSRDRMLMLSIGGGGDFQSLGTWSLSFANGFGITDLTPQTGSLPPQESHAAWDPVHDAVVLLSGDNDVVQKRKTYQLKFGSTNVTIVDVDPPGGGQVVMTPDCPDPGATVTLTAQPAAGYGFVSWSGDTSGSTNPLAFVLARDRHVVAHFAGYTLNATIDPPATGTVLRSPDQPHYAPGTVVTLTATAAVGATFSHWSGDASSSTNPRTILMDGDKTAVAHFDPGPPAIANFSPVIGPAGTVVTLTGSGFWDASAVDFNGTAATFTLISDVEAHATVPDGATDGPLHVVTSRGAATSGRNYRVGSVPAPGINLSWDDCGTSGAALKTFSCAAGSGSPFRMIGSFTPPSGIGQFLGIAAQLDLTSAGDALPDWWKHGAGSCRGTTGLVTSFDFTSGFSACEDFYVGQAVGGYAYDVAYGAPNHARLQIQCAVPFDQKGLVEPGLEYYAFSANILRTALSGTSACAGCSEPMCVVLNSVQLFQPPEAANDPILVAPSSRSFVSWQAEVANCPAATATLASVIESQADPDRVRLVWLVPNDGTVDVERRIAGGVWSARAKLAPDGERHLVYEDRDVDPGVEYDYRLSIAIPGGARIEGVTSVRVPVVARFEFTRVAWSAGGRKGSVDFSLAAAGNATLESFDAAGRRLLRRTFESLAGGAHHVDVDAGEPLPSGIYFMRLAAGGRRLVRSFAVVR